MLRGGPAERGRDGRYGDSTEELIHFVVQLESCACERPLKQSPPDAAARAIELILAPDTVDCVGHIEPDVAVTRELPLGVLS